MHHLKSGSSSGGNWTLVGVISHFSPCETGQNSIHIRIQPFLPWIYNITGMVDPDKLRSTATLLTGAFLSHHFTICVAYYSLFYVLYNSGNSFI